MTRRPPRSTRTDTLFPYTTLFRSDRCPHRFAPLSMGSLCGSSIECGYHGMRFAFDGRCVENPTQPEQALPARVHVRTYPVRERYGFMWFWAVDGDADGGLLPHFPQYRSGERRVGKECGRQF